MVFCVVDRESAVVNRQTANVKWLALPRLSDKYRGHDAFIFPTPRLSVSAVYSLQLVNLIGSRQSWIVNRSRHGGMKRQTWKENHRRGGEAQCLCLTPRLSVSAVIPCQLVNLIGSRQSWIGKRQTWKENHRRGGEAQRLCL